MMKCASFLVLLFSVVTTTALADPSDLEGGVLIAHHPPDLQYSEGQDFCQEYIEHYAIQSCAEQNNRIDLEGGHGRSSVWYVLAAWSEEKDWSGAEFGFAEYDSTIYSFVSAEPCFPSSGGIEIPATGWPGPGAGIALSTTGTHWSGNFVPIYVLAGYAYDEGEIGLAANPATGFGGTANSATPPQCWPAAAFGGMGLLQDGTGACPEGMEDGGGGTFGDGGVGGGDVQADGFEEEGGGGYEEDDPPCVVNDDGSGDYPNIQAAVSAGCLAIELGDGIFWGDGNHDILFGTVSISLYSASDHPAACVIDCDSSRSEAQSRRAITILGNCTSSCSLRGITIRDGAVST